MFVRTVFLQSIPSDECRAFVVMNFHFKGVDFVIDFCEIFCGFLGAFCPNAKQRRRIHSPGRGARCLGALLLTIGAFLLTVRAFCLQLSFFAYNGKVYLRSTSTDCKHRSSTVSKKAPTVRTQASPKFDEVVSLQKLAHDMGGCKT